jgi:predicted HTH domain antitoxin
MAVTIHLPADLEQRLRAESPDFEAEAKEAVALELFRRGKISHHELSVVLGLDRFETDAYLQRHNVVEGSLTMRDLDEQAATLDRVLGAVR